MPWVWWAFAFCSWLFGDRTVSRSGGDDMSAESLQDRARQILQLLQKQYPDARCMLDHRNAYELLMATILAAQCTDAKVNEVTPTLFAEYPDARALACANEATLEKLVRPTGFFRQKSKSLLSCAKEIIERFDGKVPDCMEELTSLRGVGRKTANVVLGECYGCPGIIVDTHFKRVTNLIGLTRQSDPDKIELELNELVPRKDRTIFSHVITFHGRAVCIARKPKCPQCVIRALCDYGSKTM